VRTTYPYDFSFTKRQDMEGRDSYLCRLYHPL